MRHSTYVLNRQSAHSEECETGSDLHHGLFSRPFAAHTCVRSLFPFSTYYIQKRRWWFGVDFSREEREKERFQPGCRPLDNCGKASFELNEKSRQKQHERRERLLGYETKYSPPSTSSTPFYVAHITI